MKDLLKHFSLYEGFVKLLLLDIIPANVLQLKMLPTWEAHLHYHLLRLNCLAGLDGWLVNYEVAYHFWETRF